MPQPQVIFYFNHNPKQMLRMFPGVQKSCRSDLKWRYITVSPWANTIPRSNYSTCRQSNSVVLSFGMTFSRFKCSVGGALLWREGSVVNGYVMEGSYKCESIAGCVANTAPYQSNSIDVETLETTQPRKTLFWLWCLCLSARTWNEVVTSRSGTVTNAHLVNVFNIMSSIQKRTGRSLTLQELTFSASLLGYIQNHCI